MAEVVWKCSFFPNLFWAAAPPGECVQQHLDFILNDVLMGRNGRDCFKVGLTFRPFDRIFTYTDYCRHDRSMYVVACSESPDFIAEAEDQAIKRYSLSHSDSGHPGCMNRSRGKLGAFHGISPFFLYVTIGNQYGWHEPNTGSGRCNIDARPWAPFLANWRATHAASGSGHGRRSSRSRSPAIGRTGGDGATGSSSDAPIV
jgi:hypothetical protein